MQHYSKLSRHIFLIAIFFIGFFFSLLIVYFSLTSNMLTKGKFFLTEVVNSYSSFDKKDNLSHIVYLEEILFGAVSHIDIQGDFEHASNTIGQLDWKFNPIHLQLETLTYHQKSLGILYPAFYRIEDPAMIQLLIPKIREKSLEDPEFMRRWQIHYLRIDLSKSGEFMDFSHSFILYQNVKIYTDKVISIKSQSPVDSFFADISKTYLYNPAHMHSVKLLKYPNLKNWNKKQFLIQYIPATQTLFILNFPSITFFNIIKLDPIGVLLCLAVGFLLSCIAWVYINNKSIFKTHFFTHHTH